MAHSVNPIGPKQILCVEDDSDSCVMLRVLLQPHEVSSAPTIKRALALARTRHFDLYVLDGTYPDGTGVELCRQLRTFDTSTPIIFFSGRSEESHIQEAMSAGAQAYLVKPMDLDTLPDTVEALLKGDRPVITIGRRS